MYNAQHRGQGASVCVCTLPPSCSFSTCEYNCLVCTPHCLSLSLSLHHCLCLAQGHYIQCTRESFRSEILGTVTTKKDEVMYFREYGSFLLRYSINEFNNARGYVYANGVPRQNSGVPPPRLTYMCNASRTVSLRRHSM